MGQYANINLEFFAREVIAAACYTHHFRASACWKPFAPYYLRSLALGPGTADDYFVYVVRDTTQKMAEYLAADEIERQKLSLVISRAAVNFYAPGIYSSLTNFGAAPPQISQICDAPEHLLSVAANLGNLTLVKHLTKSVDVNNGSYVFGKPLLNAAWKSHFQIVQFLLNEGADAGDCVNFHEQDSQHNNNWYAGGKSYSDSDFEDPRPGTALEAAALGGYEQVAQLLLQHDYRVSRSSYNYFRAITYAASSDNLDLLELMSKKADFNALSEVMTQEFWNHTLKFAAFHGSTKTIPFILDAGAQINHTILYDRFYTSALGFAALRGHNITIRILLEKGADVDGWPDSEERPISLAAHTYGFPRTVKLLLDEGAPIHPVRSRLLEQAMMYSPISVIRVLVEMGVHKRREDGGKGALGSAIFQGNHEAVVLLKSHGVTLEK